MNYEDISPLPCKLCGQIPKIEKFRDGANKRIIVKCIGNVNGTLHELYVTGESYDLAIEIWNALMDTMR